MVSRLTALEPAMVLLEASGGLELPLVAALAAEAVPVVVINPRVGGVFLPATVPSERARRRPTVFWCTATRARASRIRPKAGGSRTPSSRRGMNVCAISRPTGTSRSSSPNGIAAPAA